MLEKLRNWYRGLPDKKKYIEFLTASLSVPVLITVIILNVSNLRSKDKQTTEPPKVETKEKIIIITVPAADNKNNNLPGEIAVTMTPLPSPTATPIVSIAPSPTETAPLPSLTLVPTDNSEK